jgi:Protein of unknown function (DUF2795)
VAETSRSNDTTGRAGGAPSGTTPGAEPALPEDEVALRSRIATSLEPSVFPAERSAILDSARRQHADDDVIARLTRLPGDRRFETVSELFEALGGHTEHRDTATS